MTEAPPDISIFMPAKDPDGFKFIPPVSKVTPLPTRTIGFSPFLPAIYSIIINFDSSSEPRPTESIACMFCFSISFSPSTVTLTGMPFTASLAFCAKICGVISPPGVLASVRVLFTSSAMVWPFKTSAWQTFGQSIIKTSLIDEKPSFGGVL